MDVGYRPTHKFLVTENVNWSAKNVVLVLYGFTSVSSM